MITPELSHAPPRGSAEASARVTARPRAVASTFFRELFAKKATERPSGDQKGCWPPSVPGKGSAWGAFMLRTQIIGVPFRFATNAILLPSGETDNSTTGTEELDPAAKIAPAGGVIC